MTHNTPGLAHTLAKVPDLLPKCLSMWESPGLGIRELRLVSRETGSAALQAVRSCSLTIGDRANPERAAQLFSNAHLKELTLTLKVSSEPSAPSTEQQLATCMSHVQIILGAMRAAVKWITILHVNIQHTSHNITTPLLDHTASTNNTQSTAAPPPFRVPECLEPVIKTVMQAFAAAVPCLQTLNLNGACTASMLHAFGLICPQLHSLKVDVVTVPAAALHNISQHMPHLTHLTLTAGEGVTDGCGGFVDAAMVHLRDCAKLSCLDLKFGINVMLCRTKSWDLAPATLEEFNFDANLHPAFGVLPPRFCSRLKRLTTPEDLRGTNLQRFLTKYPALQELTALNSGSVELMCRGNANAAPDLLTLKKRFDAGFKFTCGHVGFWGSDEEVRDFMGWLPHLPSVYGCNINLTGTSHVNCLQHLARVFPNLESVFLSNEELENEAFPIGTDAEFFDPLLACTRLRMLHVLMHVRFTTKGLFKLCQQMPALQKLKYVPCDGVQYTLLKLALPLVDLDILVEEYPPSAFNVGDLDADPADAVEEEEEEDGEGGNDGGLVV